MLTLFFLHFHLFFLNYSCTNFAHFYYIKILSLVPNMFLKNMQRKMDHFFVFEWKESLVAGGGWIMNYISNQSLAEFSILILSSGPVGKTLFRYGARLLSLLFFLSCNLTSTKSEHLSKVIKIFPCLVLEKKKTDLATCKPNHFLIHYYISQSVSQSS